jgi:DNA-binding NtrC family response regulator/tetratricopeptide (TPR) repeat protein/energy-coupling factor transporter ATP-binding protein EcfA2
MTPARLELTRVEETSERRPALVPPLAVTGCPGRESELEQLQQAARHITREQLIVVEGNTGIGKSRLLAELRGRVRLDGGVVLEGRCEPGRAFGPFAEVVDRALRFLDEVGASHRAGTVRALEGLGCGHGCHRLWHQHADATPVARPVGEDGSGATPETLAFERKMRFFDGIAALLREVSAVRPPLVLLHNLERADEGTLELLGFLVDGGALVGTATDAPGMRALFVASLRSDVAPRNPRIDQLLGLEACRRMSLGPLDTAGLRAYLTSEETIARLLARTGGNPDVLDLLLEAEPLTQRSRVERRLRLLDRQGRALVDALSVLARPATLETLARVAGVAIDTRVDPTAGDLVSRTILDGEVRFVFERETQRAEVYDLIGASERREMHARAVEVCAEEFAREEAVRHAISTGNLARAAALAIAAAASLSARHAHNEAAALLESLVSAADDAPREIRVELVDLHRVAGNYRAALVHARALAEAAPREASSAARVGHLLLVSGELATAQTELTRALALAETDASAPRSLAIEVQSQLAELLYRRGRYAEARVWAERALEAARHASAARIEVQARNILGKLALAQKEPEHAARLFEENQSHAHHSGLAHLEAQALTNLAIAHLLRNDLGAAEDHCLRAIDLATLASDTRDRAIATENLAVLAHLRREYDRALEHYLTAVKLLKRLGNRSMLVRLARNLGELYLSLGDRERARAFCDHAAHLAGPGTPPPVTAERLVLRGRIEAAEGNTEAARAAFEGVVEIYEELGDVRIVDVRLELASVAIAEGDLTSARRMLALVPPQDGKRGAQLAYVQAQLERAHGGDAVAAAAAAVSAAERNGDDEKLLPALVLHATVLLDDGETGLAARTLERAQAADERLSRHVPRDAAAPWGARAIRAEIGAIAARLAASGPSRARDSVPPGRATPPGGVSVGALRARERRHASIVGSSPGIQQVLSVIDKVAAHDTIVLVRGESGTGKELVAEAIHQASPRASKPLVKVNCAALVETLLLSELFGHERGAFTGAQARKKGRFELADGGTLFLDEIGDISAKTQVALLRVLQEREFERVGGTQPIRVDVRIVCATHRDLEKMVREGTFREDLYYRLRGVTVEMPPLRRRLSDLPAIAARLLGRIADERGEAPRTLSDAALALLSQHRWPGNVRELENVLRSATLFAEGSELEAGDLAAFAESFLPAEVRAEALGAEAPRNPADIEHLVYERVRQGATSLFEMKKNLERECIVRALEETNGNITRAAALLGMKRPRLSQLVKEYELGDLGK